MNADFVSPALLGAWLLTLSACYEHPQAQAATASPTQHEVSAPNQGEVVFRLQNAVMEQLITADADYPTFIDAQRLDLAALEGRLVDNCSSLNEAADLSATGDSPGMVLKVRVLLSLAGCRRSALAARAFLANARPLLGASLP